MNDFLIAVLIVWILGYIINVIWCFRSLVKNYGWKEFGKSKKTVATIIAVGMMFWPFYYFALACWAIRDRQLTEIAWKEYQQREM